MTALLAANAYALALAVLADLVIGDPVYRFHPVRLIGRLLNFVENGLRRGGVDGYGGGIALFLILAVFSVFVLIIALFAFATVAIWLAWAVHIFILYSFLALGDLLRHVWQVERALAREDSTAARAAVANLVTRDTTHMDAAACRRAGIESLSENLTDGFLSAIFWYALAGLPGLVVFKVVSTMDSMVGYRTARYVRFGWCGARLDDAMNYIPARLSWLLIALAALVVPACSIRKSLMVGFRQNDILPSPNSGWSEAATAGAIQRRLVGPIWKEGRLVTEVWIGDPADPPASSRADTMRAFAVNVTAGLVAVAVLCWALWMR